MPCGPGMYVKGPPCGIAHGKGQPTGPRGEVPKWTYFPNLTSKIGLWLVENVSTGRSPFPRILEEGSRRKNDIPYKQFWNQPIICSPFSDGKSYDFTHFFFAMIIFPTASLCSRPTQTLFYILNKTASR